jgi:phosphatidylglycerol:prolipoprotein diacylglycerol transferase
MPLTLAAWLHDISPFLVRFTGSFGLRWYGLAYATGFLIAWWWLRWMSKRGLTPLSPQRVSDAMLMLVLGVVVGGRLGYVIFYSRDLLWTFTSSFPWWGVLQLNKGGMASHGGIIGVITAAFFIARGYGSQEPATSPTKRVSWLHVIDLTAVACTAGLMLGRIANFINGELLGRIFAMPGDPAPWWAVKFPQEVLSEPMPKGHAPKLSDAQADQLAALIDQYRVHPSQSDLDAYENVLRTLQSGGAKGADVAAKLAPLISARYPSQLLQATCEGLILGLALWLIWRKPRKPGVIGAWFMLLYGVMRIATEFVRLPDPQLAMLKENSGLSMGQWLSVGMIIVGVVGLAIATHRDVPKMGGWGKKQSPAS